MPTIPVQSMASVPSRQGATSEQLSESELRSGASRATFGEIGGLVGAFELDADS